MIINHIDKVFITSDAATIMREVTLSSFRPPISTLLSSSSSSLQLFCSRSRCRREMGLVSIRFIKADAPGFHAQSSVYRSAGWHTLQWARSFAP